MSPTSVVMVRLSPVIFIAVATVAYMADVRGADSYVLRNTLPVIVVVMLALVSLRVGGGGWAGAGWRWPLATLGFSVPALGLSLYLHYGYAVDLNGMFSESVYPREVFRYLPVYTMFAGCIGFAIGWIAGRNV
jgi:hypothetical protein